MTVNGLPCYVCGGAVRHIPNCATIKEPVTISISDEEAREICNLVILADNECLMTDAAFRLSEKLIAAFNLEENYCVSNLSGAIL